MAEIFGEKSLYVLIFKRRFMAEMFFYALSRRFVRLGFRLNCARLAAHYFAVYLVLWSF